MRRRSFSQFVIGIVVSFLGITTKKTILEHIDRPGFWIGLNDREGRPILAGSRLRVKTGDSWDEDDTEIEGKVCWAKYVAGYTLQDEYERTIGTFRFRVMGPQKIRETKDGRIDGEVLPV